MGGEWRRVSVVCGVLRGRIKRGCLVLLVSCCVVAAMVSILVVAVCCNGFPGQSLPRFVNQFKAILFVRWVRYQVLLVDCFSAGGRSKLLGLGCRCFGAVLCLSRPWCLLGSLFFLAFWN